ncbi:uracil-DNA glycosylase, partial [Bacillus pumilus]
QKKHYIIESPHPRPSSARNGFFGIRPFSKVTAYLKQMGIEEINWCIPDIE